MTVGMNVDPDNPCAAPSANRLHAAGFNGVRLTARDTPANKQYIMHMLQQHIQVVAVVATGDNSGYIPPQHEVILQIYNEPDQGGTLIGASAYADLFAEWRNKPAIKHNRSIKCWTAGFASGQPSYYSDFLQALKSNHPKVAWPDTVAIHPYLKDAQGLRDLAVEYFNIGTDVAHRDIPVVATEWFQSAGSPDPFVPFQDALNNPDTGVCTVWNSFFGWCSNMSDLPGAMVSPDGTCLPEGLALIAALGGDSTWCNPFRSQPRVGLAARVGAPSS